MQMLTTQYQVQILYSTSLSVPLRLPRPQMTFSLADFIGFHTSRYRDEFDEVGPLGRGAYGSVYRVRFKMIG